MQGTYDTFKRLAAGRYASESGRTIIEHADRYHEDGAKGWWVYVDGAATAVCHSLREALEYRWE